MGLDELERIEKVFTIFEDNSQRATFSVSETKNDYFVLKSEMVAVPSGEIQLLDEIELHRDELKLLGKWIVDTL